MNSQKSQDISNRNNVYRTKFPQSGALETIKSAGRRAGYVLNPDNGGDLALNWHTKNLNTTPVTQISNFSGIEFPLKTEIMNRDARIMRQYQLDDMLISISFGGPDGMSLSVDVSLSDTANETVLHVGYDRSEWGKPNTQEEAQSMAIPELEAWESKFRQMKKGTRKYKSED